MDPQSIGRFLEEEVNPEKYVDQQISGNNEGIMPRMMNDIRVPLRNVRQDMG
jgi:hypothetical protein